MAGIDLNLPPSANENVEVSRDRRRKRTARNGANASDAEGSLRGLSGGLILGGVIPPRDGIIRSLPPALEIGNQRRLNPRLNPRGGELVRRRRGRLAKCPVVGAVAISGRQPEMEDAITVKTNLCYPRVTNCRPVHYFGVFDGHGGDHFSFLCMEKMPQIIKEELTLLHIRMSMLIKGEIRFRPRPGVRIVEAAWKEMFNRTFSRTEELGLKCDCGKEGSHCTCDSTTAFCSGTTAVVVLLLEGYIAVGNCGDSRAILYRDNKIFPLSFDHKPDRADEKARIESRGGHVVYVDTARVEGVLAMSRAIGDSYLKPSVTSEPEVTLTKRQAGDQFIIIASDGLWDVMSNEMACHVTRQCLNHSVGHLAEYDATSPSRSEAAANLLTHLALARNSRDNISVVVIDLKRHT